MASSGERIGSLVEVRKFCEIVVACVGYSLLGIAEVGSIDELERNQTNPAVLET